MKKEDIVDLLDQLDRKLAESKREHEILNNFHKWLLSSFIYVPSVHELSNGNYFADNIRGATSSEVGQVRQLSEKLIAYAPHKKKGHDVKFVTHLKELRDIIEFEINALGLSVRCEANSFSEKPKKLKGLEDLNTFINTINRLEYDLRLTLSKLVVAEEAYSSALRARLDAIDEAYSSAQDELNRIADELHWLDQTREQFLPVVEAYERFTPIIRNHIEEANARILPRAKSQFEGALALFKIKLDELQIRAKKEGMKEGDEALEISSFSKHSSTAAYLTAKKLYTTLESAGKDFFAKPRKIPLKNFSSDCRAAIREARPILSLHRGWSETLGKLAFAITVCLSGGTALIASKAMTGSWTFFNVKTDAEDRLDELRSSFMALSA